MTDKKLASQIIVNRNAIQESGGGGGGGEVWEDITDLFVHEGDVINDETSEIYSYIVDNPYNIVNKQIKVTYTVVFNGSLAISEVEKFFYFKITSIAGNNRIGSFYWSDDYNVKFHTNYDITTKTFTFNILLFGSWLNKGITNLKIERLKND